MAATHRATARYAAEWLGIALVFAVLTAAVTWPQSAHITTRVHEHDDALFSMWRLSWIAEALTTQPTRLFDAPIFHPETRTLAYSDAVLLQGLAATAALSVGVPLLATYNVLLLAGPWLSALGTYLLLRSLLSTRAAAKQHAEASTHEGRPPRAAADQVWPAIIGGVVFGLLPYRIDHFMHLELQWSQWMPLACWALHRTVTQGRIRDGVLTAVFVLAQFLSCIYYGLFLTLALAVSAPLLLLVPTRAPILAIARALIVGAILCAAPLAAYGAPYRANQQAFGGRAAWEIYAYSASPGSFVSAPPENRLYGMATAQYGGPERRLFPGVLALLLSGVGLWVARVRRECWMYVVALVTSAVLALGTRTPVYAAVLALVPPLRGLRAPARFGMVMALALAVLAGLGASWAIGRMRHRAWRHALGGLLVAGLLIEYASEVGPLYPRAQRTPVYALWLRGQPAGGVLELPAPHPGEQPRHDPEWSFLARFHRQPLVNGYSGYYPRSYLDLLNTLIWFPSAESVGALRARGVRYIVVHEDRYLPGEFLEFDRRLRRTRGITLVGYFADLQYPAAIFTLEPE
ncbi:MAG: hypothetical protein H0V80_15820 [Acidobacteria bacterium]|nr:hypothetical protein [Acidobacteriota bacterium]